MSERRVYAQPDPSLIFPGSKLDKANGKREMEIKAKKKKTNTSTTESSGICSNNYKSYLKLRIINSINSHNVILILMYHNSMSAYLIHKTCGIFLNLRQINVTL